MNILEIAEGGHNITIAVTPQDLKNFAENIATKTREAIERELTEVKAEQYYTVDRVCEILDVDRTTLWRWNKRGYLCQIKVGGLCRYRKTDVERILQGGRK